MACLSASLALPVRVAPAAARTQRTTRVAAAAPKAAAPLASARPIAPLGLGARLRVAPAFHQVRRAPLESTAPRRRQFRAAGGSPARHFG